MKQFSLSLFVAAVLGSMSLSAQPIIHYNFENESTEGWSASGKPFPYLSVVDDPVRGPTNKVLKVDGSYGGLEQVWTQLPEAQTSGVYQLKLQILVSASGGEAPAPDYFFDRRISFVDSSGASTQTSSYIRFWRSGSTTRLDSYNGNGSGGGAFDSGPLFGYDQWLEITQTIDLDNKKWSWTLDNLTTGTTYTSGTYGFFRNIPNIQSLLFIKVGEATAGVFYLDEVRFEAIPEPGSNTAMLLGGGLGILGYTWQRRKKLSFGQRLQG